MAGPQFAIRLTPIQAPLHASKLHVAGGNLLNMQNQDNILFRVVYLKVQYWVHCCICNM